MFIVKIKIQVKSM